MTHPCEYQARMSRDPFAPARRALVVGPLVMLAGAALIALGIAGNGLAWLLCVLGGVVALIGLLRFLIGFGSLVVERRRERLLRDGVPATAVVKSVTQLGTKSGYPLIE